MFEFTLKIPKILIVDDDEDFIRLAKLRLQRNGYLILAASNINDALAVLQNDDISVILVDLFLKGEMGLDFLKIASRICDDVPIILMSQFLSINFAVLALRHGAFDYFQKLKEFEDLEGFVQKALNFHQLRKTKDIRLEKSMETIKTLNEENLKLKREIQSLKSIVNRDTNWDQRV